MRDPDTALFAKWQELMVTGEMTGLNRPVGRITVGKNKVRGHNSTQPGVWRNVLFGQPRQVELGFVQSINIERSTDQDAATATIVVANDQMLPGAYWPNGIDTGIGRPGHRSPTRGEVPEVLDASTYDGMVPGTEGDFPTSWSYDQVGEDPGSGYQTWVHPETGEVFPGVRVYDGGSGTYGGADTEHNRQLLIPNRIIRTFQGYGSDNFDAEGNEYAPDDENYVHPSDDTQLVQTGIWMIDRVVFGVDGYLTVECRDIAKLLLEQVIYPDMVPMERFPLKYCPVVEWDEERDRAAGKPGPNVITGLGAPKGHYASGNDPYVGHNASVHGHRPSHAFDGRTDTYWLSTGNAQPNTPYAYEYVTGKVSGRINQVVVNTVSTGYRAYVSVYANGAWQGSETIPYDPNHPTSFPNGANVRYVRRFTIDSSGNQVLNLPATYDAQFVRVTLHRLWNSRLGTFPYRGAIRTFEARYRRPASTVTETVNNFEDPETIQDWSEAIKELLGWGGFTWYVDRDLYPGVTEDPRLGIAIPPAWIRGEVPRDKIFYASADLVRERVYAIRANRDLPLDPESDEIWVQRIFYNGTHTIGDARNRITDKAIEVHRANPLRVWGDIERLGAGPIVCTPPEYFVNKSFMEGINQIANMIGAVFFIDESGGAVFRMPNIFSGGNFRSGAPAQDALYGEQRVDDDQFEYYMPNRWPIEFHENANLIDYQVALDDSSVRSEILVTGEFADTSVTEVMAAGYVLGMNPETGRVSAVDFDEVLAGQTRLFLVPGDDTKNFATAEECQRMAELTALKILFTYRSGTLTAPAHPGLQLDDQVRIFERITHEFNVHYVTGITSRMDLETGEWLMDVTTHWLGTDPRRSGEDGSDDWFMNTMEMTPAVRNLPAIAARLP